MENKINSINTLVSAIEARNEQLHDEIKKNEEAIKEMKVELEKLMAKEELIEEDNRLKMVA